MEMTVTSRGEIFYDFYLAACTTQSALRFFLEREGYAELDVNRLSLIPRSERNPKNEASIMNAVDKLEALRFLTGMTQDFMCNPHYYYAPQTCVNIRCLSTRAKRSVSFTIMDKLYGLFRAEYEESEFQGQPGYESYKNEINGYLRRKRDSLRVPDLLSAGLTAGVDYELV